MQKLTEVEEARALLTEAREWSIWRWLSEKKKVRHTADRGTSALEALEKKVKSGWSAELKKAYAALDAPPDDDDDPWAEAEFEAMKSQAGDVDPKIHEAAQRVKEADDIAYRARMQAEQTFEDAERKLSAALARQGADQALKAYDVREEAIRAAEAARRVKAGSNR